MISGEVIVAAGSLTVSAVLAGIQVNRWVKDNHSAEKARILKEGKGPAETEAIIVSSAERAVRILEQALNRMNGQLHQAEQEIADLRQELDMAHREIVDLRAQLHAMRRENQG